MFCHIYKKSGFNGGFCLTLTIISCKSLTVQIQGNLCMISIITQLSARSGFNRHFYISRLHLHGMDLYLVWQLGLLVVFMSLNSKKILLHFNFFQCFCRYTQVVKVAIWDRAKQRWGEHLTYDSCKGLAAIFSALSGSGQHSGKELGFWATFINLFFSSHLSKSFCTSLESPPWSCLTFRESTICWMRRVWGLENNEINMNAEFDFMLTSALSLRWRQQALRRLMNYQIDAFFDLGRENGEWRD